MFQIQMKPQVFSSPQLQTTPLAGLTEHVGPVISDDSSKVCPASVSLCSPPAPTAIETGSALVSHSACSPPDSCPQIRLSGEATHSHGFFIRISAGKYFELFFFFLPVKIPDPCRICKALCNHGGRGFLSPG